ncbi:hypothetical protein LWF15_30705 [Kineosporia rhizophila]|uniref:hypothetical protein n=1 Tax=Kineosporia TaxID=49184 RepID=UPI000B19C54E|nr:MULTISPECIES: hypothetical protein [Kineosporia]MCE0539875.1 hypothetical protein [Kineosporia rhizophila]GLY19742.1 hypothetical protein Kisp01_67560 [Kineosporia sp. NBRC 101677]
MAARAEIVQAFEGDARFRVNVGGRSIHFHVANADASDTQVWWNISDAELSTLASSFAKDEKAAYGSSSGGMATLITLLVGELSMFEGARGEIVAQADGGIAIEAR